MKFLIAIGLLIAFIFGGLFGLTAGINLNPESTVQYVPNWGSVGDWVSGIGAFLAVIVAIWLADTQRKDNAERLKLTGTIGPSNNGSAMFGGVDLVIDIVSSGNRPVNLSGARIGVANFNSGWNAYMTGSTGKGFPVLLNYGESTQIRLSQGDMKMVFKYFDDKHQGDLSKAQITVFSTLGHWQLDLSDLLVQLKVRDS
jgi:hypothetical protein